jgi:hypothetical protein
MQFHQRGGEASSHEGAAMDRHAISLDIDGRRSAAALVVLLVSNH